LLSVNLMLIGLAFPISLFFNGNYVHIINNVIY
jgi:hypothetical protein